VHVCSQEVRTQTQTNSGELNAAVQKSQEQLKKIKNDLHALTAAKRNKLNVVEDTSPPSIDPTAVMSQVDMIIDQLTKAQEASEQDTTPGSHDSYPNN